MLPKSVCIRFAEKLGFSEGSIRVWDLFQRKEGGFEEDGEGGFKGETPERQDSTGC